MAAANTPTLIMGCQRSGTTLLGMVLDSHPVVAVIDEDDGRFHRVGQLTHLLDFRRALRASAASSTLLLFKSPRDTHRVDTFLTAAPRTRLIWIRRPVEQVVASMCALRVAAESWAVTHAHREVRKYLLTTPDDLDMAEAFAAACAQRDPRQKELTLGTLCWCAKERSLRQVSERHAHNLHVLRYVDLVTDAELVSKRLCEFLDIDWDPRLLRHHHTHVGERIGGTVSERPIDADSLQKWRYSLGDLDVRIIHRTVEALAG